MNSLFILAVTAATNLATRLAPVVVEASPLDQTSADIPAQVEIFSRGAIAESGAGDLPQLLSRARGMNIYNLGAGNPALAQIQMRGWGENGFGRVYFGIPLRPEGGNDTRRASAQVGGKCASGSEG